MSKKKGRPPFGTGFGKAGSKGAGNSLGKKPRGRFEGDSSVYVKDDAPRMNAPRKRETQAQSKLNMRLGEFSIDRLSHDGRGIAAQEGKTLFIEGALAGERVSARLVAEHPRFIEARIDQLLEASADRVEPPCVHFALCGGCQLQHMAPEHQLQMKQQALLDQVERWAGLRPARVLAPVTSLSQGYRARARLGVWYENDGSVTLGFRQKSSNELTPISSCLVLAPQLNALLEPLRTWLQALKAAKAVTHIELIATEQTRAAIVRHTKALTAADIAGLTQLAETQQLQIWLEPNDKQGLRNLAGESVDPRLHYALANGDDLGFHPQDFTQVNPQVNRLMVQQALDLLQLSASDKLVDFFCGMGNFTLPMARLCAQVTGVEGVETMVERGRANAEYLGIANAEFFKTDLGGLTHPQVRKLCREADAILLDPPRDGAKGLVEEIKNLGAKGQLSAKRIVYVSCNPATLARDAKLLAEAGYKLEALGVLDMFPHTSHLESMALFLL